MGCRVGGCSEGLAPNGSWLLRLDRDKRESKMLWLAKQELELQVSTLASDKKFAVTEQNLLIAKKDNVIPTFSEKIEQMLNTLSKMVGKLEATQDVNIKLTVQTAYLQEHIDDTTKILKEKELAFEEARATIAALEEDALSVVKSQLSVDVNKLRKVFLKLQASIDAHSRELCNSFLVFVSDCSRSGLTKNGARPQIPHLCCCTLKKEICVFFISRFHRKLEIEWSYLVRCDKFIALYNAIALKGHIICYPSEIIY